MKKVMDPESQKSTDPTVSESLSLKKQHKKSRGQKMKNPTLSLFTPNNDNIIILAVLHSIKILKIAYLELRSVVPDVHSLLHGNVAPHRQFDYPANTWIYIVHFGLLAY